MNNSKILLTTKYVVLSICTYSIFRRHLELQMLKAVRWSHVPYPYFQWWINKGKHSGVKVLRSTFMPIGKSLKRVQFTSQGLFHWDEYLEQQKWGGSQLILFPGSICHGQFIFFLSKINFMNGNSFSGQ